MKSYNTISNALNLAVSENGDPSGWASASAENNGYDVDVTQTILDKILLPNLKVIKTCSLSNASDCVSLNSYKYLGGGDSMSEEVLDELNMEDSNVDFILVLADGSIVMTSASADLSRVGIEFFIDVNGPKGPNVFGRDLFELEYIHDSETRKYSLTTAEDWDADDDECNPANPDASGWSCTSRLLQQGAMNY